VTDRGSTSQQLAVSRERREDQAMSQGRKTDREIHHDVLEELKWDPRIDETDVGVEVDGGIVTLTGTVTSWAKRLAAQDAVRRVAGVLDVANDVVVKTPGGWLRTDTEIAHAVRQTLEWDVFVPDEHITSSVTDGRVTLEGVVDTLTQRHDAERAVENLAGVVAVINKITVRAAPEVDDRVQRAIERALERRAERQARRIGVEVRDGIATLSGAVTSWAERRALLGAAQSTPGVTAVKDALWPES
jgi:osmotically-inducible protein OsmY